ncbi:MAG: serine/threonine protein phosphatase [Deltaproteobacteria bacterium]|nr:serine/threonine protein phosphatase [Deltaproteobacteria bacterium]
MTKYRELTEKPRRLFAIGDIHGCPDELEFLLEYLRNTLNIDDQDQVVFIGDYIDRGVSSKAVLECLLRFQKLQPKTIFLRGNHEDMLLGFLGFEGRGGAYLANGGDVFFESYGIKEFKTPTDARERIPASHISFLLNLDRYVISDSYVFAHAGLDPLRDLHSQLDQDLFWIRDPFIENIHNFNRTVLFGHTPYQDLLLHLPYKIGIDTGLVYGNILTCVELMNEQVYQVKAGGTKVEVSSFKEKALG